MNKLALSVLALACTALSAFAQVNFPSAGTVYTQNFNSLASDSNVSVNDYTTTSWGQNATLPGWYLYTTSLSDSAVTSYFAKDGNGKTYGFWSYGSEGTTDRALGSLVQNNVNYYDIDYSTTLTPGTDVGYIAVALKNTSSGVLGGVTLSYTGEEWRESNAPTSNTIRVDYGIGDTFAGVTKWTATDPALFFTTTQFGATAALNGNSAANRVAGLNGTITAAWQPGQTLWIRWVEANDGGIDQGWAIDDVSITSNVATVTDVAPVITTQPTAATTVAVGDSATFTAAASGTPTPTFQWSKDNVVLPNATDATLTLNNIQLSDAGSYTVTATNSAGSDTSAAAVLTVHAVAIAPTITQQPTTQALVTGAGLTLSVTADGTPPFTYQWSKNGAPISGATDATLSIPHVAAGDVADYTVTITNAAGTVVSGVASLTVSHPVFWVATTGSDSAAGTQDQPWLTLAHARQYIQTAGLNAAMTEDIIVNVEAGEYYQSSNALSFSTPDSGSNGFSVTYRSVDGPGMAVLTAGTRSTGWQLNTPGGNIWKINVGASKAIRTVFENGRNADLAREPNRVVKPRYAVYDGAYRSSASSGAIDGTNNYINYNAGEFNPSAWTMTSAAQVVWWTDSSYHNWGLEARAINSIDPVNRTISFASSGTVPSDNERYFIQGIFELLDAPGEFFYDTATGWLYYYPRDGDPNAQDIRVPLANQVISIAGAAPGTHAHDLKFDGFSVAYARGTGGAQAAIALQSTDHIQILNCHFFSLGDSAISMTDANAYNTVYGCLIEHTGTGGIWLNNTLNRTTNPNDLSQYNTISNCEIHDIGENLVSPIRTAGVLLFCTNNCDVNHCDIYNSARYGISLRGHWSTQYTPNDSGLHFSHDNHFSYMRLTDCETDSGDAGILHAAHCNGSGDPNGAGNINFWNQILISGGYEDPGMDDWKSFGIYCDHPESCLYQNFSNIKVTWVEGAQYHLNDNPTQTLTNVNFSGSFDDTQMQYSQIGLLADFPSAYDDRRTVIADDHTDDYTESDAIYPANVTLGSRLSPQNAPNSSWSDSTSGNLNKGDGRVHAYNASGSSQYAQWSPLLPKAGVYAVWAWKMDSDANSSAAAPYTVFYDGGSQDVTVNQQTGSAGWVYLGAHPFVAGRAASSGFVRLFTKSSDGKAVTADAVKFVLVDAPVITTQPVTQTAAERSSVRLSVAATSDAALTYQWSKDNTAINGATDATLTLNSAQVTDAGSYTVVVTNAVGSVTSAAAVLTVTYAVPAITSQPVTQTAVAGTSLSLSVTAVSGATLSYQWSKDSTVIDGATAATLTLNPLKLADAGSYTVVVTNVAGSVTSDAAVLTVTSAPIITSQPATQAVVVGTSASFSVIATSGPTMSYQWYKDSAVIDGATNATLTLNPAQFTDAASYTVVVTNVIGSVTSTAATLTVIDVNTAPVINHQPATQTAVAGTSVSFTAAAASGSAVSYQWSKDNVAISGATDATFTLNQVKPTDAGNYTVVITNTYGSVTSDAATLTVTAPPTITTQPATQTATAGTSVSLSVTATSTVASGSTMSYQWSKDGTAIKGATDATLTLSPVQLTSAGSYTVVVTNAIGSVTSDAAILTVTSVTLARTYFGTLTNGGHWALDVHSDRTATYIAYLPDRHSAVIVHLTIADDGTFTTTGTETGVQATSVGVHAESVALAVAGNFTLTGQITGASVSGQLSGLGESLTGAADATGGATAGIYTASALGTSSGTSYVIVGPSGQALFVAVTPSGVDGATGTLNAGGQLTATTSGGAQLSLTVNAGAQTVSAAVTPTGGGTAVSFSGLADSATSTARIVNISSRAYGSTGDSVAIGGFVITGSSNKRVLLRAVGPTLATQGVAATDVMADPVLELHDASAGNAIIASNDNWGDNANAADITTTTSLIGATALAGTDTQSSALLLDLPPGVYSIVVSGKGGTSGVVLAEVYDADTANLNARLVNISTRAYASTGNHVAIGGYVVTGNAPKHLLIRAVGPTLGLLGVDPAEVMLDPTIEVHDAINGNAIIATNDNVNDNADPDAIAATASRLGATAIDASDTKSSALLVTLPPGVYSFVVRGQGDTSGIVLLEIYDAD